MLAGQISCRPNEPGTVVREDQLTVHSNVAKRSCAVVLNIRIRRVEEGDKNGDSAGIDELLTVLVYSVSNISKSAQ